MLLVWWMALHRHDERFRVLECFKTQNECPSCLVFPYCIANLSVGCPTAFDLLTFRCVIGAERKHYCRCPWTLLPVGNVSDIDNKLCQKYTNHSSLLKPLDTVYSAERFHNTYSIIAFYVVPYVVYIYYSFKIETCLLPPEPNGRLHVFTVCVL
jgi:hypothetical protein